jgi:hypothetical protein
MPDVMDELMPASSANKLDRSLIRRPNCVKRAHPGNHISVKAQEDRQGWVPPQERHI